MRKGDEWKKKMKCSRETERDQGGMWSVFGVFCAVEEALYMQPGHETGHNRCLSVSVSNTRTRSLTGPHTL